MSITFASSKDREQLKAIYQACFPDDPASFWDFELDHLMQSDNILVYREGDQILSTVQILPEQLTLQGKIYPVQYIYAAATLPEAQGRGLMGQLLEEAHALARERGQWFSVLITQNDSLFDFYARFGYRDCGKVGLVQADPAACCGCGKVRAAEAKDTPKMLELYHRAQCDQLSVARTIETMDLQREIYGTHVLVFETDGVITAYGIRIGNRMLEVMGPDANILLSASNSICGYTLPTENATLMRNGCVLPLTKRAETLLEAQQKIVYLNLMWN